ncbi:MAG: outer membrane beta-barrel protein [Pyrinomonadaceae bacterium]
MKKYIFAFSLLIISSVLASAQNSDDYKKGKFFIGYSHGLVDGSTYRFVDTQQGFGDTGPSKFHGFNAAGVYNVSRYVGLKADFSGTYNGGNINISVNPTTSITGRADNSLYNVLGGVQFKDNSSDRRLKPFAHFLAGVGLARTKVEAACAPTANCTGVIPPASSNETGFSGAFGAGFDLKLNDRFDLRLVQMDYNPVNLDSGMLHNVRIGVGIVIK